MGDGIMLLIMTMVLLMTMLIMMVIIMITRSLGARLLAGAPSGLLTSSVAAGAGIGYSRSWMIMTFTSIEASQGDLDRKDGGRLGRGRTIVEAACSAKRNNDDDHNYRPGYDDQY